MKCFFCNREMTKEKTTYVNKWGNKNKVEQVHAYVCCDRMVFEPEEAKRLQELAKKY